MKLIFDQKHDIFHTYDCMLSNFKWLERGLQEGSKHFTVRKALYNIVLNQMSPRHISGILYEYPQFTM